MAVLRLRSSSVDLAKVSVEALAGHIVCILWTVCAYTVKHIRHPTADSVHGVIVGSLVGEIAGIPWGVLRIPVGKPTDEMWQTFVCMSSCASSYTLRGVLWDERFMRVPMDVL